MENKRDFSAAIRTDLFRVAEKVKSKVRLDFKLLLREVEIAPTSVSALTFTREFLRIPFRSLVAARSLGHPSEPFFSFSRRRESLRCVICRCLIIVISIMNARCVSATHFSSHERERDGKKERGGGGKERDFVMRKMCSRVFTYERMNNAISKKTG